MKYFFEDPANVARLHEVLRSWHGTPFYRFSKVKGAAADCLGFLEGVTVEVGLVEPFEFPRSDRDYSRHLRDENLNKILDYMRGLNPDPQSARLKAHFEELELVKDDTGVLRLTNPMPGDVLVYKDHSVFHLPIVFEGRKFYHCMYGLGVTEGNMEDNTFEPFLVAAFRARAVPNEVSS